MGPTASGKSTLAENLAKRFSAILINADAFQVYRGFDVGTNKPSDRSQYHLIDICDPAEEFGVGAWIRLVVPLLSQAFADQRDVVIVGGTGYYIRALMEEFKDLHESPSQDLRQSLMRREEQEGAGSLRHELIRLNPESAAQIDLQNPVRVRRALEKLLSQGSPLHFKLPEFEKFKIGLRWQKEELRRRIEERTQAMLDPWAEEVEQILTSGVPASAPAWRAIGYQSVADWVNGLGTRSDACEAIVKETWQYSKRQGTWLRKEPYLQWVDLNEGNHNRILSGDAWTVDWTAGK